MILLDKYGIGQRGDTFDDSVYGHRRNWPFFIRDFIDDGRFKIAGGKYVKTIIEQIYRRVISVHFIRSYNYINHSIVKCDDVYDHWFCQCGPVDV